MTRTARHLGRSPRLGSFLAAVVIAGGIGGQACGAYAQAASAEPPAAGEAVLVEETPSYVELDPRLIELEADKASRGRALIAAGVPMLVFGGAAIGLGLAVQCHRPGDRMTGAIAMGSTFAVIGVGFTTGGIVSLLRASKAGRDAPRTRSQRRRIAGAATGSIIFSALSTILVTGSESVDCINS